MSKNFLKIFFIIFALIVVVMPAFSFAQDAGLVPCGTEKTPQLDSQGVAVKDANGNPILVIKNPCGFNDLFTLVNKVVNFILIFLAVPIAAIMFAYAGFLMVTGGGSTEKASRAKSIFTNVAIGLIFIAGAWLIINTILSILGYNGSWIGIGIGS